MVVTAVAQKLDEGADTAAKIKRRRMMMKDEDMVWRQDRRPGQGTRMASNSRGWHADNDVEVCIKSRELSEAASDKQDSQHTDILASEPDMGLTKSSRLRVQHTPRHKSCTS